MPPAAAPNFAVSCLSAVEMKTQIFPTLRSVMLACICLIFSLRSHAQNYFQKVYIEPFDQEAQDVLTMPDGGYLLPGYTTNSTLNDMDAQVIKTDASGNKLWKKTYGGAKPDFINRALATSD